MPKGPNYNRTHPQIRLWRKRRRRYAVLKAEIVEHLRTVKIPNLAEFLETPSPLLRGNTPKQYMNPTNIVALHKYILSLK